jgi:hypothetical protein
MADKEPTGSAEVTPERLKAAFKAFKRRLKVTRLEAESKISGGPLSGGRRSTIVAIMPPTDFPKEVWDALVKQGKLKYGGSGTYELVEN